MPKSRQLEELLAALEAILDDPSSKQGITTLTRLLAAKPSLAVARAAKTVVASAPVSGGVTQSRQLSRP